MNLHLNPIFNRHSQQTDREKIANKRKPIVCIRSRQLIGSQLPILTLSPGNRIIFDLTNIEQLRPLNTFLQTPHEIVLVIVVMFEYLPCNFPEEDEDRVIHSRKHNENGYQFGPVGRYELYSCDQNNQIFVYSEYTVTSYVYLLVILRKNMDTWLYLSANLTLYWLTYQVIGLFVNWLKLSLYMLLPIIIAIRVLN